MNARVGIGELKVTVPADVALRVKGDAQIGDVDVFDRHADGHDPTVTVTGSGGRVLVLHLHVGLGQVTREPRRTMTHDAASALRS